MGLQVRLGEGPSPRRSNLRRGEVETGQFCASSLPRQSSPLPWLRGKNQKECPPTLRLGVGHWALTEMSHFAFFHRTISKPKTKQDQN